MRRSIRELDALDRAVYTAIAATPTPTLDLRLRQISNAANHSRLWFGVAGGLGAVGQRQAALQGLAAIGVASAVANLVIKPLLVRRRPDRAVVAVARQVRMPVSTSFPSGHAASAFAFAAATGAECPPTSLPLHLAATAVAYSRVHTGVHYPSDVVIGAVIGTVAGGLVHRSLRRRLERRG